MTFIGNPHEGELKYLITTLNLHFLYSPFFVLLTKLRSNLGNCSSVFLNLSSILLLSHLYHGNADHFLADRIDKHHITTSPVRAGPPVIRKYMTLKRSYSIQVTQISVARSLSSYSSVIL